jgi:hypothetical protein
MPRRRAGGSLLPLFLLWLAFHAALVAMLLAMKFLFAKSVTVAVVLAACTVFLVTGCKHAWQKVSHDPVL